MQIGDRVRFMGHGRIREGMIERLTPKYAWVRYSTPHGRDSILKRARRENVFLTREALDARERRNQREREEMLAKLRAQVNAMPVQRLPRSADEI